MELKYTTVEEFMEKLKKLDPKAKLGIRVYDGARTWAMGTDLVIEEYDLSGDKYQLIDINRKGYDGYEGYY